jgi:hypothetical protein
LIPIKNKKKSLEEWMGEMETVSEELDALN